MRLEPAVGGQLPRLAAALGWADAAETVIRARARVRWRQGRLALARPGGGHPPRGPSRGLRPPEPGARLGLRAAPRPRCLRALGRAGAHEGGLGATCRGRRRAGPHVRGRAPRSGGDDADGLPPRALDSRWCDGVPLVRGGRRSLRRGWRLRRLGALARLGRRFPSGRVRGLPGRIGSGRGGARPGEPAVWRVAGRMDRARILQRRGHPDRECARARRCPPGRARSRAAPGCRRDERGGLPGTARGPDGPGLDGARRR